jgi:hypothetical protein
VCVIPFILLVTSEYSILRLCEELSSMALFPLPLINMIKKKTTDFFALKMKKNLN